MTIKEKLYKEFVIIMNKVNTLRGENLIGGDNVEEYFNSSIFSCQASSFTKDEIKRMISDAERSYENEVEKLRIENYFNTPEGSIEKANMTKEIAALENKIDNLFRTSTQSVDSFIKGWLGEEWGCGVVRSHYLEIGMVEETTEDGRNNFYFGHSFSLYFDNCISKKDEFAMNYGCMSSFKLFNDEGGNLRCKFLLGMATFANDKENLQTLKNMLDEHKNTLYELEKNLNTMRYNLSHPFDKRKVA